MKALVDLTDKDAVYAALDASGLSYSLDVNLLLFASDRSERHEKARDFLDSCAAVQTCSA